MLEHHATCPREQFWDCADEIPGGPSCGCPRGWPRLAKPAAPNLSGLCPLAQEVARLLLSRPGRWVSMQELARIGGTGGWSTRVREVRRHLKGKGWTVENRQGRVQTADGPRRTSEYRIVAV